MTQNNVELIIVTGISGGGKTNTLRILEDYGYFCVDNLIPVMLSSFVKLVSDEFNLIAVVVDSRGGKHLAELNNALQELKALKISYKIVFLDVDDKTLVKRFSETRRRHHLVNDENPLIESIAIERGLLAEIRSYSDQIIDTSNFSLSQLRKTITESLINETLASSSMRISVISFGFKYGSPVDADLVFDVRFLPNPHYIADLKAQTGLDLPVRDYVYGKEQTQVFLEKFLEFITYLIPHYQKEGKSLLNIAIGCTGGRHRSVAIASKLSENLRSCGHYVVEKHRDIERNNKYYQDKALKEQK